MKKILAYLLVLVSLMTLFCGTAGAADNSMDKNGYATTYVSMLVYDTDAKAAKYENVPVGCWTVVGRCYYATSDGRTYYPESASVQKATFSPYKGGISKYYDCTVSIFYLADYGEWQADASEFALFLSHLGETLYECVKAKC